MHQNVEETQLKRSKPLTNERLFDYAKKLIWRGANIDYASFSMAEGKTVLSQAIEHANRAAIRFCLDQNANPHIEDL